MKTKRILTAEGTEKRSNIFWSPWDSISLVGATRRVAPTINLINARRTIFLFLLGLFVLPQMVLAHGGGILQVSNVPIATYQVSVWTNPPTARAGQAIHVTVGVSTAVSGEPVLDAAVDVLILDSSGEVVSTAAATTEQSINRLFYEADLEGVSVGTYEAVVQVMGSEGSGELTFPLPVKPVSIWPWVGGVLAGAAVIGLVLRYWRKGSRGAVSRQRTAVPRRHSVD